MELKLDGKKLIVGDKCFQLTEEQLKELGIVINPFNIKYNDKYYYISLKGKVISDVYDGTLFETEMLKNDKLCKDKKLMEQKALRQNLNDKLWKFTIENGWSDELWEDVDTSKWAISFNCISKECYTRWTNYYKSQGAIHFISEEIAQRAIDEIIKPYVEEYPEFIW